MPLTFLLLQLTNAALAVAMLWIRFKNPFLWDDQGMVIVPICGILMVSLTAIILGLSLAFRNETKWGYVILNLALTTGFAVLQGYFLLIMGRDMGLLQMLKARLG